MFVKNQKPDCAVATASTLGVTDFPFPFMQETGDDTKLFHQSVAGGTSASLDVELAGPLSDTAVDTLTATLIVPGVGSVVDETLTETVADSRVFANAAQTFQITISAGAETLDPTRPDEIYAVVTESTLGVTELAFPSMQETGDDTKVFHKDVHSSDEYVADYTGFTFALSQLSQVGASGGGLFKPYVLQVQGPALFLQYLQEIEFDDGPRLVEQSPIDNKYYVKMKNSPTLVAHFYAKRVQAGEPDIAAALGAMKDYANYHYGFAKGFYAAGYDMGEGIISLAKFVGVKAYDYSNPRILWRMAHLDTFETEQRFVKSTAATTAKFAQIYAEVAQDQIAVLTALCNGTHVEANEISPYSIALVQGAELIVEFAKDLANEYQNDPQKRGFYDGYVTFEIVTIIVAELKIGKLGQLSKATFLERLAARPSFSPGGKCYPAMQRLQALFGSITSTRMSHGLLTAVLRYERQFPNDTPWQTFKKVLDANRGKGNFNARDWGWGLKEKNDAWYRLVAQNELPLSAAPSVHELKTATKGMGIGKGPDAKHIHHAVEAKRYQKNLNIPPQEWDDVPGFVMDGVEHNGPGGLTHHLYREIGDTTDANAIIAGHRLVYEERGLNDLWAVTEKWFISKGFTIPPRAP